MSPNFFKPKLTPACASSKVCKFIMELSVIIFLWTSSKYHSLSKTFFLFLRWWWWDDGEMMVRWWWEGQFFGAAQRGQGNPPAWSPHQPKHPTIKQTIINILQLCQLGTQTKKESQRGVVSCQDDLWHSFSVETVILRNCSNWLKRKVPVWAWGSNWFGSGFFFK